MATRKLKRSDAAAPRESEATVGIGAEVESERALEYRDWLHSQASLENVIRALSKNSIQARNFLLPVLEWVETRLRSDEWIVRQLDALKPNETKELQQVLMRGIVSFSRASDRAAGNSCVPHKHKTQKVKAFKAIGKLIASLKELNFDPELTELLDGESFIWAKNLLDLEMKESPREANLFARLLKSAGPDQDAYEELRQIYHSRKRAPRMVDLLISLEERLAGLEATRNSKLSPHSIFLRDVWSGLFGHCLETKRLKFVLHVNDVLFPGHWNGEVETRQRELTRLTADSKAREEWFTEHFGEWYLQIKNRANE